MQNFILCIFKTNIYAIKYYNSMHYVINIEPGTDIE